MGGGKQKLRFVCLKTGLSYEMGQHMGGYLRYAQHKTTISTKICINYLMPNFLFNNVFAISFKKCHTFVHFSVIWKRLESF